MSTYETFTPRAFYRSADRAVLGGVCAGIADYFGFNLRVLRFLAIIAFICAMPFAVIAYLAIVFLVPARAGSRYERAEKAPRMSRKERKRARKEARADERRRAQEAPAAAANEVRNKCEVLNQRLAKLEKYITSSRYQLDREFRNL